MTSSEVPFTLTRVGVVMTPEPGNPHEAMGVLNPASGRTPDGRLHLLPRLVAAGNVSRVGLAEVELRDGVPVGVWRRGEVLAPDEGWERGANNAGVEDPRTTWVPSLGRHLMTYVAYGPLGPRLALAVSEDLEQWERLGPVQFALPARSRHRPEHVSQQGRGLLPRAGAGPATAGRRTRCCTGPMWDLGWFREGETVHLPAGVTDERPGIWISYVPAAELAEPTSARSRARATTGCVATVRAPVRGAEDRGRAAAGAGRRGVAAHPPRRDRRASPIGFDPTTQTVELRRRRDDPRPDDPSRVLARTQEPHARARRPRRSARHRAQRRVPDRDRGGRRSAIRLLRHGRRARSASPASTAQHDPRDAPLGLGVVGAGGFAGVPGRTPWPTCPDFVWRRSPTPTRTGPKASRTGTAARTRQLAGGPAHRSRGRRRRGHRRPAVRRTPTIARAALAPAGTSGARSRWPPTRTARRRARGRRASGRGSWSSTTCCATTRCCGPLGRLWQGRCSGRSQRFFFENDASDEDLDRRPLVLGRGARAAASSSSTGCTSSTRRAPAGRHPAPRSRAGDAAAREAARRPGQRRRPAPGRSRSPAHLTGFTHAHRCERQLMRLDHGTAEVRVEGWIPVRAVLDGVDRRRRGPRPGDGCRHGPPRCCPCEGYRRSAANAVITVEVDRDAGSADRRGTGRTRVVPHHVRAELTLGGEAAQAARLRRERARRRGRPGPRVATGATATALGAR